MLYNVHVIFLLAGVVLYLQLCWPNLAIIVLHQAALLFLLCMFLLPCRRLRHAVRDTMSLTIRLLAVMGVSVSVSMLHQMSTIIPSLWILQLHQISYEVLPITSVLLLVLTYVTQHVIALAVRNQPNYVESQVPLKSVSK